MFNHIVDTNGDIVAVGYKRIAGGTNAEIVILKLDNDLNIIFSKVFIYGTGDDIAQNVYQDASSNYIITGYVVRATTGPVAYVMKLDTNFNILGTNSLDGSNFDRFYGAVPVTDGIIAYGLSDSTTTFGQTDMWVTKFGNNLETPTLSKKFGGTGYDSINNAIVVDNNFIGCGYYLTANVPYELAAIIKLDANLNFIKGFNLGTSLIHGNFTKIIKLPTNEMIAVGYTFPQTGGSPNARGILVKVDSNLNLIAQKTFSIGSESVTLENILLNDNELVIIGNVGADAINISNTSAFIAKIDLDLTTVKYIKKLSATNKHVLLRDVCFDKNNNIIFTGRVRKATTVEADILFLRLEKNSDIIDTTLTTNNIIITTPVLTISTSSYAMTTIPNTSVGTSYSAGAITLTTGTISYTKLTDII